MVAFTDEDLRGAFRVRFTIPIERVPDSERRKYGRALEVWRDGPIIRASSEAAAAAIASSNKLVPWFATHIEVKPIAPDDGADELPWGEP